mmetsp:Transcript_24519/g.62914  ORF Transcript_24519/g.62914 Transcript_24519/m.62914 type:complete len:230 (+) Transcript_24519:254-943(+)
MEKIDRTQMAGGATTLSDFLRYDEPIPVSHTFLGHEVTYSVVNSQSGTIIGGGVVLVPPGAPIRTAIRWLRTCGFAPMTFNGVKLSEDSATMASAAIPLWRTILELDLGTAGYILCFKTILGRTIILTFLNGSIASIASTKTKIQDVEGIPSGQQRLIFPSRQLDDHRTLTDYGIRTKSTLLVVPRTMCGGGPMFVHVDAESAMVVRAWNSSAPRCRWIQYCPFCNSHR